MATLMWLDLGGRYLPHKLAQKGEAINWVAPVNTQDRAQVPG